MVTAIVPIAGSPAEASHYSLLQPPAITIELPHARSALGLGIHSVQRDGLRSITILARHDGGIQIRFSFMGNLPELKTLQVGEAAVKVTIAAADGRP